MPSPLKTAIKLPLSFSLSETDFLLRELAPEDTEAFRSFFNQLKPETVRCRFGYMISQINSDKARAMISVDRRTETALAIFDTQGEKIQAVGRYFLNERDPHAEIAVVVADSMRRKGLARFLLQFLIRHSRSRGVLKIHAYIATEHAPILLLLKSLGFTPASWTEEGDTQMTLDLRVKPKGATK